MAIPNHQTLMWPVLVLHADGREYRFEATRGRHPKRFRITEDERGQMLPSGRTPLAPFDELIGPTPGIIVSDRWRGYEHLEPPLPAGKYSHSGAYPCRIYKVRDFWMRSG